MEGILGLVDYFRANASEQKMHITGQWFKLHASLMGRERGDNQKTGLLLTI